MAPSLGHVSAGSAERSERVVGGRRDLGTAGLGLVMVAGVYLDGWAHLHEPGLETFFTPWHAVLYSAFGLLATSILTVAVRGAWSSGSLRKAIPVGYGQAVTGVAVFASGGLGDMVWHQILGVEVGLDALLSPTHLVLLVGAVLMTSAPAVAAARAPGTLTSGLSVALSVAATAAAVGFFVSYLSVFTDAAAGLVLVKVPEGTPGHAEAELPAAAGLGAYLVTTAAIVVPILALRRRFRAVPIGTVVATTASVALLGAGLTSFAHLGPALGAIVGSLLVELVLGLTRARSNWVAVGGLVPGGVWSGQLLGLALTATVGWSVQLWAGVVVLTVLAGLVFGGLGQPAARGTA